MVDLSAEPVAIPGEQGRFIYITGCDGTGKSTQSRLLLSQLQAAGVRARLVWLRFPFLFSLPLLVYARWRRLSWYETSGEVRHGYWDFRRSHLLRACLPWTLFMDACLARLVGINIPLWHGETVICERFVLDMLVDLSVAFGEEDLHRRLPGRLYLWLLPTNPKIFILDLDVATIQDRRPDLCSDRFLNTRLEVYRRISSDLSLQRLSSSLPVKILNTIIRKSVGGVDAT